MVGIMESEETYFLRSIPMNRTQITDLGVYVCCHTHPCATKKNNFNFSFFLMRPLIQILKKVKWKIEEKKKNQNLFQIEGGGGGRLFMTSCTYYSRFWNCCCFQLVSHQKCREVLVSWIKWILDRVLRFSRGNKYSSFPIHSTIFSECFLHY